MVNENSFSINNKIFAYCMSQGMDVPPMEQWEYAVPSENLVEKYMARHQPQAQTQTND